MRERMAAMVTSLHRPRLMCHQHDGQHVNGSSQADGRQRWKWGPGPGARLAGLCNQRKVTELVFQGPVISSCKCHFVLCFLLDPSLFVPSGIGGLREVLYAFDLTAHMSALVKPDVVFIE